MEYMDGQKRYSAEVVNDYIKLKTWGLLDERDVDAPANAALELAETHKITKLLDDIREVDTSGLSIAIQTKSMGILWKLRHFKKVAIVMNDSKLQSVFFSTLEALHLNLDAKFKSFNNEAEAISWLKETS